MLNITPPQRAVIHPFFIINLLPFSALTRIKFAAIFVQKIILIIVLLTIFVQGLDVLIVLDLTREHVHIMQKTNSVWRKKNTDKYCQKCSKTFSSDDCFVYHQKYACKIFSKCKICNKYFRKSTGHQCGFFYCRVCYSFHKSDNKTCFVRPNISFKKNESNYFFLDINLKDEIPLYIALTNIKDFTLLYKYPSSMSKYLEYSVFKEIIYKDTTNVIFEFCKFLFDESKKHKGMTILASDNTIQYLLYFLREFEKFFVNLSNFTIQNITFKNVGLFLNLPHTQIANKIKLNPCLARIPNQINENWSKNELYDFKSEDFCLMSLFGNSQADCEKFINGLQSVSNFVDKKSYYGK